jgi:RNA polymerase sigma-70 factor (ECF subfamily)
MSQATGETEFEPVLHRVAQGEAGAFQEAIDRFGPLVWSLARRMSPTPSDAEDAAQEIFVDLWQSAARYDSAIASEATFIGLIARRRLIDRARKMGRRPQSVALPEELPQGTSNEPGDGMEARDEADHVRQAMQDLKPAQQEVLKLSIFQGMTHEQIAAKTGMPLGTVKTHARRGMMKLREMLAASSSGGVS